MWGAEGNGSAVSNIDWERLRLWHVFIMQIFRRKDITMKWRKIRCRFFWDMGKRPNRGNGWGMQLEYPISDRKDSFGFLEYT